MPKKSLQPAAKNNTMLSQQGTIQNNVNIGPGAAMPPAEECARLEQLHPGITKWHMDRVDLEQVTRHKAIDRDLSFRDRGQKHAYWVSMFAIASAGAVGVSPLIVDEVRYVMGAVLFIGPFAIGLLRRYVGKFIE